MSDPKEGRATGTVRVSINRKRAVVIFTPDCNHFVKNDDAKYAVFLHKSSAKRLVPRKLDWHDKGVKLQFLDGPTKDELLPALITAAESETSVEIAVDGSFLVTGLSIPA